MTKRKHVSKDAKIASLLLEVWSLRGQGIPYAEAKLLTAAQICSLAEWHHSTPHAIGGDVHPVNLTAMPILDHRKRTREIDVPAIAKSKRIARKHAQHLTAMAAKINGHIDSRGMLPVDVRGGMGGGAPELTDLTPARRKVDKKRKWPSRKMPSRPFAKRRGRPC